MMKREMICKSFAVAGMAVWLAAIMACKTMEEAYRERYKVLIHNNAMPPSPRYGTKTGTVIAVAFLVITVMVLALNIMWSCGGCQ